MPIDGTDMAIMYLLNSGGDMGLAGRNRAERQAASGGGGKGGGGDGGGESRDRSARPERSARQVRERTRGAGRIIGASTRGIADIISAARGDPRGTAAVPVEAPLPPLPQDDLGAGGVSVTTPWGKIALGGIAGLVVIGGIIWLVSAKKEAPAPVRASAAPATAA